MNLMFQMIIFNFSSYFASSELKNDTYGVFGGAESESGTGFAPPVLVTHPTMEVGLWGKGAMVPNFKIKSQSSKNLYSGYYCTG